MIEFPHYLTESPLVIQALSRPSVHVKAFGAITDSLTQHPVPDAATDVMEGQKLAIQDDVSTDLLVSLICQPHNAIVLEEAYQIRTMAICMPL
jgi:hypothetical protein